MATKDSRMEVQEIYSEAEESYSASDSDDTESDPDYDIIEDAQNKLSNLSIKKEGKACVVEGEGPPMEIDPEEMELTALVLDEKDEKNFVKVQKIIEAGELEELKVLECKLYLRKNGLRLTGNKDTLIQRIREHLEIINGGGERKYPPSSFVLNCKGDACTGDVVLFEQNVYEMFNIVSRSASGPPCGKRTVAGRIVKESYGAVKQQHTFTIEVLWSKGEKSLPPLYPLLIKGRNLYRLKTLRQRWGDEGERQKKLMEKHSRGNVARAHREARIQEKEKRKLVRENRVSNKWSSSIQSQSRPLMTESQYLPPGSINPAKPKILNSRNHQALKSSIDWINPPLNIDHTRKDKFCENYYGPNIHSREKQIPIEYHPHPYIPDRFGERPHHRRPLTSANHLLPLTQNTESYDKFCENYYGPNIHSRKKQIPVEYHPHPYIPDRFGERPHHRRPLTSANHLLPLTQNRESYDKFCENYYGPNIHSRKKQIPVEYHPHPYIPDRFGERPHHRRPLTSANHLLPLTQNRESYERKQLCRYHAQGRWCPFGDNCKFSHDLREQQNRMQKYAHRH